MEGFFKSHHAGYFKRNIIAVDWMHFSVINTYSDVAYIRSRKRSLLHFFHHTFQDRRYKASIDNTSDNTVIENKFSSPCKIMSFGISYRKILHWRHIIIIGFYFHEYLAKLACTA
ncbi:hypothetical protein D3C80_1618510 [compost metagenome]